MDVDNSLRGLPFRDTFTVKRSFKEHEQLFREKLKKQYSEKSNANFRSLSDA
jgi:hypothetical protein